MGITETVMVLKGSLNQEDYDLINALQTLCCQEDQITLKLELDYKLGDSLARGDKVRNDINEFMCFDGKQLIGYAGICSFGGAGSPFEITGMVHPDYRRQGIFSRLHELVIAESKRRNNGGMLGLCDKKSLSGMSFLEKIGAIYQYSEFEMFLNDEAGMNPEDSMNPVEQSRGIHLKKAANSEAGEVARQNAIYFGDHEESENENAANGGILLPEEEEKRGMTIYLAEKDGKTIGKVHLQLTSGIGGIYGLGVLPEYRGKGFGRAILLGAIEKLKNAAATEIMLQVAAENDTALSLYKSCGFWETSVMDYYKLG